MEQRNKRIWIASAVAAIATSAIGLVHQGYLSWRVYLAMPGLMIGLLSGLFVDSPIIIIPATIGTNAFIYYGIAKGFLSLANRERAN